MRRIVRCAIVVLTLGGIVAPQAIRAEPLRRNSGQANANAERVVDVALHDGGVLVGFLLNPQNVPVTDSDVLIHRQGQLVAKTTTNEQGRFVVAGLRGGAYEIVCDGDLAAVRAWAPGTAPPNALQTVLVVTHDDVIRGQTEGDSGVSLSGGITGSPDLDSAIIGAGFGLGIWGIVELANAS